jgi:hypothetical protein
MMSLKGSINDVNYSYIIRISFSTISHYITIHSSLRTANDARIMSGIFFLFNAQNYENDISELFCEEFIGQNKSYTYFAAGQHT